MMDVCLENFLLHARNLRNFFAAAGKHDDVLAADFLGRPMRVRLPLLRSQGIRKRLNKSLAHLSYSRSRFRARWPGDRLYTEINQAMNRFAARLRVKRPEVAKGIF